MIAQNREEHSAMMGEHVTSYIVNNLFCAHVNDAV